MPARHARDCDAARSGRREFLARCSAAAAAGLLCGRPAEAIDSSRAAPGELPTVKLGSHTVTRLIVGMYPRHFDQVHANAGHARELG